jgi:hypothetical protein
MDSVHVATLTRDPSTSTTTTPSTALLHRSNSNSRNLSQPPFLANSLQNSEPFSDPEYIPARSKIRRRGNSFVTPHHPTINTASATPSQPTDVRPKTSDGPTSPWSRLSPTQTFNSNSYFTRSTGSDIRSPTIRRPPASRSSHGVATSSGPPPAISTQRAYSFDAPKPKRDSSGSIQSKLTPRALAQLDAANNNPQQSEEKELELSDKVQIQNKAMPTVTHTMDRERKRYSIENSRLATQRLSAQLDNANHILDAKSDKSSQEDLFLNIAQANVGDDDTIQQDRKVSLNFDLRRN